MKTKISYEIIKHLESCGHEWGGNIEDHMRWTKGTKGDTTARILRFLAEDGIIVCEKKQINGVGRKVNYYSLPIKQPKVLEKYAVEHVGDQLAFI